MYTTLYTHYNLVYMSVYYNVYYTIHTLVYMLVYYNVHYTIHTGLSREFMWLKYCKISGACTPS